MGLKILVIDDEKDIVRLLKDFFELQGYLVYTAFNGIEALEKIEIIPDIILLDINMPRMNGIELCKRIRHHVSCPILFLTAKIEEQDRINGLMVGGDDYILKPFSLEELSARFQAHLRREERRLGKDRVRFSEQFLISFTERKLFYREEEVSLIKTEFDA